MNPNMYDYFVLKDNGNPKNKYNANYSFNGYTDGRSGVLMQIFKGAKTEDGKDIPKRWKFDPAHRMIRVHKNDASIKQSQIGTDNNGEPIMGFLKSSDFLRNYADCKGSPNGDKDNPDNYKYSEVKAEEDAQIAVDAKKIKNKAENVALNLEKGELKEMAILIKCFSEGEAMQQMKVADYAAANPSKFLEFYNSPERSIKALLQKAVSIGVVNLRGTLYVWGDETLGTSADFAISKLMGDEDFATALREEVRSKNK